MKYDKIQSIFKRNPDNKHKTFLKGEWTRPEFEYLAHQTWIGTEKIDGTNIRVYWDTQTVDFAGRTDKAQIPANLVNRLNELFPKRNFQDVFPDCSVTLYGEGYGAGIQKGGGNYKPNGVDFILFDVMIGGIYLHREDVRDIASKLGIQVVPELFRGTLWEAYYTIAGDKPYVSEVAYEPIVPEGLVLTPEVPLLDRRGKRIITKIKYQDFEREAVNVHAASV